MIIVFGSINLDHSLLMERLPGDGETVIARDYALSYGGKGANQALAAARSGAKVALVGKVGQDGLAAEMLSSLRRGGVMTSGVGRSDLPTGCAFIARDRLGENQIVVAPGANAETTADQVPDEILAPGAVVLMQMEVPVAENITLMEHAKARGATTILNLAPALNFPKEALAHVDVLIVNEVEARQLAAHLHVRADEHALLKMAALLAEAGNLTCVMTLGAQGAVAVAADGHGWEVGAMKLDHAVDTTGAGDCFCGTLAAALHDGRPLPQALKRASVAASLSCLKPGAQASYPLMGDIEKNLAHVADAAPVSP